MSAFLVNDKKGGTHFINAANVVRVYAREDKVVKVHLVGEELIEITQTLEEVAKSLQDALKG